MNPRSVARLRACGLTTLLLALAAISGCEQRHSGSRPAFASPADGPSSPPPLPLIPVPVEGQRHNGRFEVATNTPISVPVGDDAARRSAHYLADLLQRSRGLNLPVRSEASASHGSIRLQRDPQSPVAQQEGYALEVDQDGLRIRARDEAGLFYGAISAWQLLTPDAQRGPVTVPAASIRDWPRFSWRGQHLDVARHFVEVGEVKRLIDAMALHKLNVLHLHLSDDQGWRVEIKRYPRLTEVGAWRTPPGAGEQGSPSRVGGFYTQDQIRDLVAYAAQRQITLLPEIDLPGHAQAAVAAYPDEVGVPAGQPPAVGVNWGIEPWLFDTDQRSLHFIYGVLDELLALFPSKFIHIGGDEAIKDQWQASPKVRAQMRALGVKDAHAMQGWFNTQLAQYLSGKGRRLIGWDEILEGGLPDSATVMSWRGLDGAIQAAGQGHDVVLSAAGWLYLDNLQTARSDEPAGRLSVLPLRRVYELDPVPAELSAAQRQHVLGAQGQLWTEYVNSSWHIEHALYPRVAAVAEAVWSPMPARGWEGFLARLPAQLARYRALGIGYSDGAFAADIALAGGANPVLAGAPAKVELGNQAGHGQIRYSTDGSEPTLQSRRYEAPFAVSLPVTVKAAVFADNGLPLATTRSHHFDRAGLLSSDSQRLVNCHDQGPLGLRVPLLPDLDARDTPVYDINVFDACWIYPQARLDGIATIRVEAARLARNYGLAHDQNKVVQYPARSRGGELEILAGCQGPRLASVPLPAGERLGERFTLDAPIPAQRGIQDVCLRFTAPISGPLYAIGRVRLIEHDAQPPRAQP